MRALVLAVTLAGCSFQPGALRPGDGDSGTGDGASDPDGTNAGLDASVDVMVTSEWPYRRDLSFNNAGNGALADFTVMVRLDSTRVRYSAAGADLRFTDATGTTPLDHEIESWNTGGSSYVWVQVPAIPAGSVTTTIRMYYGNPSAADAQNPTGTWDASYEGVWHLKNTTAADATGKNTSTNNGATARAGVIGGALDFSGANQYVDTGDTTHLTTWTIEAWMNPDTAVAAGVMPQAVISRFENYMILWSCMGATFCSTVMYNGSAGFTHNASYAATAGIWTYVVGRYNGTTLSAWSGGVQIDTETTSDTPLATAGITAKIGTRQDLAGDFDGGIDEARISNIARSDDYIRGQHRSMTDTFVAFGPELPN